MDIFDLLIEKKKLLANMNNSDPIVMVYALGAYNLCDELLRHINDNIDISNSMKKTIPDSYCKGRSRKNIAIFKGPWISLLLVFKNKVLFH